MVIYAVLSGLRPNIASYVTRQKQQTLEQLTEAARVAELTNTENVHFAEVKTEIWKLVARWDQMTSLIACSEEGHRWKKDNITKRVTFLQLPVQPQPSNQHRNTWGGYQGGFRGSFWGGFNARKVNNVPQWGQETKFETLIAVVSRWTRRLEASWNVIWGEWVS